VVVVHYAPQITVTPYVINTQCDYVLTMLAFASYFTHRFSTGGTIEKVQNYIKRNCEGVT